VLLVWNVPEYGTHTAAMLDLLSDVLGSGKTSRLYKRLVYQDQIATDASAYVALREIAGQVLLQATARPGVPLERVEAALREELSKLLEEGPTEREMQRVRTQFEAGFVRGIERIGGFGGKSDILAMNQVYLGDPAFYKTWLGWVREASAEALLDAGREWLRDGVFALQVHPYPELAAAATGAARDTMPAPGDAPPLRLPGFRRATLSNGLRLLVAERHDTPQVQLELIVPGGHAADSVALAGCARLTMALMDEGTSKRDALELSDELALLGARLDSGSNLDSVNVSLAALTAHLDASLSLFAEVILSPTFPESEFSRLRNLQLDAIRREKMSPVQAALRVFPRFLFGADHAYGKPYSGAGTEESVASLTAEQVRAFHAAWFKPNHSVLTVVGDTTLEEIQPKLEELFADWAPGEIPPLQVAAVDLPQAPRVILIDKPEATQSVIVAGHVAPPTNRPEAPAIDVLNAALGGMFTSRINMNLREQKHWTYGARSVFLDAVRQRPFLVYTSVQADKTREAMAEILKELQEVRFARPVQGEELAKAQANLTLELPGSRETLRAIREDLERITTYGLADDYFQSYPQRVKALDEATLQQTAHAVLQPERLTWVVVGDLTKIRADVEAGHFGTVEIVPAKRSTGFAV
ncbi:MAG: insulinase family protein, partial [Bryobacterales bacterium]|nr:insulinase family protein [Bryobacterales bacterium]